MGIETHVAYRADGPNLPRLLQSDVVLHPLKALGNHDPALGFGVLRLIRILRPDVVQTWLPQMDILGGGAALLNRVPLIISERSSAAAYEHSWWKARLRVAIGKRATRIIANSHGGVSYWCDYVPTERLHVIRNCVVPNEQNGHTEDARVKKFLDGRSLIIFAGRLSYEKNIPNLTEAFISVARRRNDVAIMMFGEGPERQLAEHRIAEAGLQNRIELMGYSTSLSAWIRNADVCVSVSHFEGHPNVVMEAASLGCPLVLSQIGAHCELFDEKSASWARAGSPSSISDAIISVLHDPWTAREHARRARDVASKFSLANIADEYRSIYKAVVENHRR